MALVDRLWFQIPAPSGTGCFWGGSVWTVEPDDDLGSLVRCSGNWRDAIDTFEAVCHA